MVSCQGFRAICRKMNPKGDVLFCTQSSQQNTMITGWWFETLFICRYIGNFIIPIDELIFFRAVCPTTRSSMFIILSMQEKNDEKKYDSMISIIYINLHDLSSISKIRVLQLHPAFKAPPEAQDAPDRRGEGFQSSAGSPGF